MSPISRDEFNTAKVKSETADELIAKLSTFLKEHADQAYSTRELCDTLEVKDSDQILMRCFKLQKERKLEGYKPKHSRVFYWIWFRPKRLPVKEEKDAKLDSGEN
jgi:hypothetical protein